jgi:hypothetical protein
MTQVLGLRRRLGPDVDAELDHEHAPVAAPPPSVATALLSLQRSAGNHVVATMIQRQFADRGRQGELPIGGIDADAVDAKDLEEGEVEAVEIDADGVTIESFDDDEEAEGRGPAHPGDRGAKPQAVATSKVGEMDGLITSGVHACAMTDLGRTGEDRWHHCGGGGGKQVESLGTANLVAPTYKSGSSSRSGGRPKAWIEEGTGTVDVTRSFWGVPRGAQGAFVNPPPGTVWMTTAAKRRVDKHEREHAKSEKAIYDHHIQPLEQRVAKRRGPDHAVRADTEAKALTKLRAEIDWDASVKAFADEEWAENRPMGPIDQADMATADFYASFGRRKINGVVYTDYYDIPPGPKARKKRKTKKSSSKSTSSATQTGGTPSN